MIVLDGITAMPLLDGTLARGKCIEQPLGLVERLGGPAPSRREVSGERARPFVDAKHQPEDEHVRKRRSLGQLDLGRAVAASATLRAGEPPDSAMHWRSPSSPSWPRSSGGSLLPGFSSAARRYRSPARGIRGCRTS